MAKERSFWSSIPGVLTGTAGLLTGVVGLLGLALSQGWIGDGPTEEEQAGGGDAEIVRLGVEPTSLRLAKAPVGEAVETVTVTNEGNVGVTVVAEVTGEDASSFTPGGSCGGGEIAPGRSCEVDVTFDAGVGNYSAVLVVSPAGSDQAQEVRLEATSGNFLG